MLFNSIEFAIFLPIVFLIYWFVVNKNLRLQNLFVVGISYLFYGWWDYRFLALIAFTSLCSYYSGIFIERARENVTPNNSAKYIAVTNIVINLAILGLFKYFNFFSKNMERLFSLFGAELDWVTLDILLPVGISFYTFQAISYTIDVYRKQIEPTHDIVSFFAFVSFFPQLVAGPIERSTNLLPQFYKQRTFDYAKAVDGSRQILLGLFKKMVIADNCAIAVNSIWANYEDQSGFVLLMGLVLFAFQLYCDFSGYSDIAIGTGRLFGINLMQNFNSPYLAKTFNDYWKRNHISLTQWFMDYVYYPLIGSSSKLWYWNLCMVFTFLLSGLWHGSSWTFVLWGLYQGIFIVLSINNAKRRKKFEKKYNLKNNLIYEWLCIVKTFLIVCIGLVFFRAESISQAFDYLGRIVSKASFDINGIGSNWNVMLIVLLMIVEWLQRDKQHILQLSQELFKYRVIRFILYYIIILIIIAQKNTPNTFIYFQF